MTKRTFAQEMALENFGVELPQSKEACTLLIRYIKEGNYCGGKTLEDRIAIWKGSCNKYIGKRVKDIYDDEGVVVALSPRNGQTVMRQRAVDKKLTGGFQTRAPFKVRVKWDTGKTTTVAVSTIVELDGHEVPEMTA